MPDPFSKEIIYLDPNNIEVTKPRQRSEIDIDDIMDSIRENGVINPIIIKQQPEPKFPLLIAGERRLEACKRLNIQVPCRYYSSLNLIDLLKIEFEENEKRKSLPWRDRVKAIGEIHDLYLKQTPSWPQSQTAKSLSIQEPTLSNILYVYNNLNLPLLLHAENLSQAISLLNRFKTEKDQKLEGEIKSILTSNPKPLPSYFLPSSIPPPKLDNSLIIEDLNPPVLNLDFLSWIKEYSGPKFNFLHCDFPQSENNFNPILYSFIDNIEKLLAPKAHILFWFQMPRFTDITEDFLNFFDLRNLDLKINTTPLIWLKSDINQTQLQDSSPKNTYEAALILTLGSKPFLKQINNSYTSPRNSNPICPNQKPIPMLKYFLQTFINEDSVVFDPTCGSGSALIAAEELGVKTILGLELDPNRAKKANEQITRFREIRRLIKKE